MRRIAMSLGAAIACALTACGSTCTMPSGAYTVSLAQDNSGNCGAATLFVTDGGTSLVSGAPTDLCARETTVSVENPLARATATGSILWSHDASSGTGPMDYTLCNLGTNGEDAGCCHSPSAEATFARP